MAPQPPPGWYPDPGGHGKRWWNGWSWGAAPLAGQPIGGRRPHRSTWIVLGVVVLGVIAAVALAAVLIYRAAVSQSNAEESCKFYATNGLFVAASGDICSGLESKLASSTGETLTKETAAPWPVLQTACSLTQGDSKVKVQVLQVGLVTLPIVAPEEAGTICSDFEQDGWSG